jgi:hypothetical protein
MSDLQDHLSKIKQQPGLLTLLDASFFLSTGIHEGRRLKFAFLYSDGRGWQAVEETISDESQNQQTPFNSRDFADYVHAHWSIFQADGVAGFIDRDDVKRYRKGITITKIVRLRNPDHKLLGQLFKDDITGRIQGAYVVYCAGDGRVRIFAGGKEIIQWNTMINQIELVQENTKLIVTSLLNIMGMNDNKNLKGIMEEAIQEVSENQGEGAMLLIGEESLIGDYLSQMDDGEKKMAWRQEKQVLTLDKTLLRAMMILDGATWIKANSRDIEPRFVVYPHCECPKAFSVLSPSCQCKLGEGYSKMPRALLDLKKLEGKGSKHHGAANLSMLLVLKNNDYCNRFKNYLESQTDIDLPFRIITISCDGDVKEWPKEFKIES